MSMATYFTVDVRGAVWRFAALPMGWYLSPYYLCALVAMMVRYLRKPDFAIYFRLTKPPRRRLRSRKTRGVCLLTFVDDFLFLVPTEAHALRLRALVEHVWVRLVLSTKAHPNPKQRLQHLGIEIYMDLARPCMRFRAPPKNSKSWPVLRAISCVERPATNAWYPRARWPP